MLQQDVILHACLPWHFFLFELKNLKFELLLSNHFFCCLTKLNAHFKVFEDLLHNKAPPFRELWQPAMLWFVKTPAQIWLDPTVDPSGVGRNHRAGGHREN